MLLNEVDQLLLTSNCRSWTVSCSQSWCRQLLSVLLPSAFISPLLSAVVSPVVSNCCQSWAVKWCQSWCCQLLSVLSCQLLSVLSLQLLSVLVLSAVVSPELSVVVSHVAFSCVVSCCQSLYYQLFSVQVRSAIVRPTAFSCCQSWAVSCCQSWCRQLSSRPHADSVQWPEKKLPQNPGPLEQYRV